MATTPPDAATSAAASLSLQAETRDAEAGPDRNTRHETVEKRLLRDVLHRFRWRLALTYGLFNLENLLALLQPYVLGWAITDLLRASSFGVLVFVGQYLVQTLVSTIRLMYDTRTFTGIYTELTSRLVVQQRQRAVDVSCVAARSALSRELVDFFERDVGGMLCTLYSLVGAVVMLALHDVVLGLSCLALMPPAMLINAVYGRKSTVLNGHLNDQFEREVDIVARSRTQEVHQHYHHLAYWRIRLSDCQALAYGWGEVMALGLLTIALVRSCREPSNTAGDIYALFRYVLMFVIGLNNIPMIVQQIARLRDIYRRLHT